jgi:hypothetical protein
MTFCSMHDEKRTISKPEFGKVKLKICVRLI